MDFIRINLGILLSMSLSIIVILILLFVTLKRSPAEFKPALIIVTSFLIAAMVFTVGIKLINQSSVNLIPNQNIDRSYTTQSIDSYKERVKKESQK
jgi:cytochrome c biogenesis factor